MLTFGATHAMAQATTQPAAPQTKIQVASPNPELAAYNREVAKSLRRKLIRAMEVSNNSAEPLKTASAEQAQHLEELVAAVEELANAADAGEVDRTNNANKAYAAIKNKSAGFQERAAAAREELTLINNNAALEMKTIAGPLDQAQIDQYSSARARAIEAWAQVRKISRESPDGVGLASAKINATRLTLSANRYERFVNLKIKASRIRGKAEKSDTPDLYNQIANSLDKLAADLAKNLDQQIELKTSELELNLKQSQLESQVQSLLK